MSISVNRTGYLVTYSIPVRELGKGPAPHDGGYRTYACADEAALAALILRLTGRELSTYPRRSTHPQWKEKSESIMWTIPGVQIAHPLHIYSTSTGCETEIATVCGHVRFGTTLSCVKDYGHKGQHNYGRTKRHTAPCS